MRFSRQLHAIALATGLSSWLARRRPARRVIMFHGVDEVEMPVDAFEANLRWLAARFNIVPLGAMVDGVLAGRAPDPRGELVLTFDDGLGNHFGAAYPVLQRLGLPATFFVCPELIERGAWIWNQEARERMKSLSPQVRREFGVQSLKTDSADVEALVACMKGLPIADRRRAEDDLRARTPDFAASALQRRRFDPLTWSEVEQLDQKLITIGSHTLSHPILPTIDDAMLERELRDSRQLLEQRLGRAIDLFCYPNGAQDDRVHAAVARHYRAAVTTRYGLVPPDTDAHRMVRIPATPSLPTLAWRLHRPLA
jgi:peptidoglycan/xylan/chitin deacetylase (PgdA/CDA1 family)